jgi:hypothetical protein
MGFPSDFSPFTFSQQKCSLTFPIHTNAIDFRYIMHKSLTFPIYKVHISHFPWTMYKYM